MAIETNPPKYKVKIMIFQAGDPHGTLVFRNESKDINNNPIPIKNITLTISLFTDSNPDLEPTSFFFPSIPPYDSQNPTTEVTLIRYFATDPSPSTFISGELIFSTTEGGTFEVSHSSDCPSSEPPIGNVFSYQVLFSILPSFTPSVGDVLAIRSKIGGAFVFLTGNTNGELTLTRNFNSLSNPGGRWIIGSGINSEYTLTCTNGNYAHDVLSGDTSSNSISLVGEASNQSKELWQFAPLDPSKNDSFKIKNVTAPYSSFYLKNEIVQLKLTTSKDSDATTWYLHKLGPTNQ